MSPRQAIRVLALIPPIEQHVGHWACSSPSISVTRVIMEEDNHSERVLEAARNCRPHAIAIIGKLSSRYLDLLERVEAELPLLRTLPRIYRCQNTALAHRVPGTETWTRQALGSLSSWFLRASDPRFSLVLVQTLDDVELIRRALHGIHVAACPYGYDTAIFDPALPELERTIDVGCYFNLKNNPHREMLVKMAREICCRRGWSFRFFSGKYWHQYAWLIRTTKVCLHYSMHQEIPYRMYEVTCLGALFLTDPLRYSVDHFFTLGSEYLTFHPDLRDLESVLESVLESPEQWNAIRCNGRNRARHYSWPQIAERYVASPLVEVIGARCSAGAVT